MKKLGKPLQREAFWKTSWPKDGDPAAWFSSGIRKCNAIEDDDLASEIAEPLIEALARTGAADEALRGVDRFLKRTPARTGEFRYRSLALTGAQIAYDINDLTCMEEYLRLVAGQCKYMSRKADADYPLQQVAEFRIDNGIQVPDVALDDDLYDRARFTWNRRLLGRARKQRVKQRYLSQMESAAQGVTSYFCREKAHQELLIEYACRGEKEAVKRVMRRLDKELAERVLDFETLLAIDEEAKALKRASSIVRACLDELSETEDPNIHFPVGRMSRAITELAKAGYLKRAKRLFRSVAKSVSSWPVYEYAWITAGVYANLSEMATAVGESAAARSFALAGLGDASVGKRVAFTKSVQASLLRQLVVLGMEDEALAQASTLRSPKQKRLETAKIFVLAKRWKEASDVCRQAKSPEEAAQMVWSIRFELPGGVPW